MEEPTIIEMISLMIWCAWTGYAVIYFSRHKSSLKMLSAKVEGIIKITDKWSTHKDNKAEDIEDYKQTKAGLSICLLKESDFKFNREDLITFSWYAFAFIFGSVGLYRLISRIF